MSVVRHAAEAGLLKPARRLLPPLAAFAAILTLAGCSGSKSPSAKPAPDNRIPLPVSLVTCGDWQQANVRERRGTVAAIRRFAGGPVGSPAGRGAVLTDPQAYRLFQHDCSNSFERAFKLYKLYTRAAALYGH